MKTRYKTIILLFFMFLSNPINIKAQNISSGPPKPPLGKRWVLNPDFSDEFNGTELDTTKWLDNHPTWKGREPGLFMSSQVSVKDGCLQIKGEKMKKDTVIFAYGRNLTFNIKGGAVVSKKSTFLGYYESKIKAAATTMSATFWFSTSKKARGSKGCDKYGLEWDIQECVGRTGNFDGTYFASGMHSNSHYWYTDCDGKTHDYRATQVVFEEDELASENFHVYGGWWRNENEASYYYDDRAPKHQFFYDSINKKPFDKPMHMRLVCETYPFPWIELPNAEELSDPSKNTVYYDWVRGYKLVNVDNPSLDTKQDVNVSIYDEAIIFDATSISIKPSNKIEIPLSYKANEDREIVLKLQTFEGEKIAKKTFKVYAGYANMIYSFTVDKKLLNTNRYKLGASIQPLNAEKNESIDKNTLVINLLN